MNATKTAVAPLASNKKSWQDFTAYIGLVLMIVLAVVINPTFSTSNNIMNIFRQVATPGMLAIGMNFAIITGGIDLSVGSTMGLVGVLMALLTPSLGVVPAIIVAVIAGGGMGLFFGFCITKLYVPAFIATLAGQMLLRGIAFVITKSQAVPVKVESFGKVLGTTNVHPVVAYVILAALAVLIIKMLVDDLRAQKKALFAIIKTVVLLGIMVAVGLFVRATNGINVQVIIFGAFFLLFWVVLNKTVFGRQVYAIGGNTEASRLAGVKVDKNLIMVYGISGLTAAIGGILTTARLSAAAPGAGQMYETDAICAVVIGGTSLAGGSGKLTGSIIGVLLIGVLNNLLSLENVASDYQLVAKGVIVLVAVVLDTKLKRR